jgi:toxin ParE1/3/4
VSEVRLGKEARLDLAAIWDHVAQDSPQAADRLNFVILEKCRLLAEFPHMGRDRSELARALRSFPVGSYLIFYRPLPNGVEVVRVMSGLRQLEAQFFPDEPGE